MTEKFTDMSAMPKEAKKTQSPAQVERAAVRELVRAARERGEDLTGPGGLLNTLTKAVLEAALDEELTEHLGYDKRAVNGRGSGDSRNGIRTKTVLTDNVGPVQVDVPRDRAGTFEPVVVHKRQRRLGDVDTIVLSLYARGLTTRGDLRALRRDLRRIPLEGPDQCDHRPGHRGDAGLVCPAAASGVRSDLRRRDLREGPRRSGR